MSVSAIPRLLRPGRPGTEAQGAELAKAAVRDEVLYLRAAGVDVGKRFVVACVRTPSPKGGRWQLETARFETTPAAVRELAGWLAQRGVEVVVLEATGDYVRHEGV